MRIKYCGFCGHRYGNQLAPSCDRCGDGAKQLPAYGSWQAKSYEAAKYEAASKGWLTDTEFDPVFPY